ncbi:hypothetical protein SG34_028160 [Thalassomonas viridans]|uniref:Uncharacterized protein n=1 Tax=Thalassomonas viridans TaxID=137584 RepID=A0AAF0C7B6_9GAMM|nr:hypothetical protein [Thalassomonas viridans]WDE05127.1 hypothetical protein SG34_028160 [Thalassomonas viridans]
MVCRKLVFVLLPLLLLSVGAYAGGGGGGGAVPPGASVPALHPVFHLLLVFGIGLLMKKKNK